MTEDPIRDSRNWYAYVYNDPVNLVDPLGLCGESDKYTQLAQEMTKRYMQKIGLEELPKDPRAIPIDFQIPISIQRDPEALEKAIDKYFNPSPYEEGLIIHLGIIGLIGGGGAAVLESGVLVGYEDDRIKIAGYTKEGAGLLLGGGSASVGVTLGITIGTGDPNELKSDPDAITWQMGGSVITPLVFLSVGGDVTIPKEGITTVSVNVCSTVRFPIPMEGHVMVTKTQVTEWIDIYLVGKR